MIEKIEEKEEGNENEVSFVLNGIKETEIIIKMNEEKIEGTKEEICIKLFLKKDGKKFFK